MNKKEFIDFARENLLSSHQARHITGQSRANCLINPLQMVI